MLAIPTMNNYGHLFPEDQDRLVNDLDRLYRKTMAVGVPLGSEDGRVAA